MKITLKYRNLIISIAIIAIWVLVNFLAFYPDKQGLGSTYGVSVLYIFTAYGSLLLGVILILLRIVKVWKNPDALLYVLMGVANFAIGLFAIALYSLNLADREWLNKSLLNLLVGFLIITDIFLVEI